MPTTRRRMLVFALGLLAILGSSARSRAQAALLMEEPYGFFGTLNPTGHTALYFSHICAETPVKLRRCEPGELGSVIARYQGIDGYDWVAMPLIPYLYSVEDSSEVPERVNRETVLRLRKLYHEEHLGSLGTHVFEGNMVHGGWAQFVGVAYERRIYAFRFATTEEQDETLMDLLNDRRNKSHFDLIYNNCADFARGLMNFYFPQTFKRTLFPDAGMTTPREITFKLEHYAKTHPEVQLEIFEIPQVPGYRRHSGTNKSVSASLITSGYAIPIAIVNPYLAGGIFVDYLIRGRFPPIHGHPEVLQPDQLSRLTDKAQVSQNPIGGGVQSGAALNAAPPVPGRPAAISGLTEIPDPHE
jgi:hypothetical protein